MSLPVYPDFDDIDLSMREDLIPRFRAANTGGVSDGVSEFTFAGLYLFRAQYGYRVAMLPDGSPIITGSKNGEPFFLLPLGLPHSDALLLELFELGYLKNLSTSDVETARPRLETLGATLIEDRDNSDYLYLATDLAHLPGKKFHKKRNHVNAFEAHYTHQVREIDRDTVGDAHTVLDLWNDERDEPADYRASKEALDLYRELELTGIVVYVDETPVAYALGEPLPNGDSFVVHSEKAITGYRGAYQFVNSAFARRLAGIYTYINREQDLGDPGLRQAKMTYRPAGFVTKYRVTAPRPAAGARPHAEVAIEAEPSCCG